jgi:hypothetical protein
VCYAADAPTDSSPSFSLMSWRIPLALHSSVSDEWEFGRHLYLTVLEISNINLMLPGKMLTETPEISLPFVFGMVYRFSSCCSLLFNSGISLSLEVFDSILHHIYDHTLI